jgi:drug/metabolite transporter (DMT)-like permease
MGLIYCSVAVCFFTAFYLLLGRSQKSSTSPTGLNLAAFCAGTVLSGAAALPLQASDFPRAVAVIGALIGVTAGLGLLGITLAVRSGVVLSIVNTTASLSLAVPILLSFAWYGEGPSPRKWAGLVLAGLSIVLIQREKR